MSSQRRRRATTGGDVGAVAVAMLPVPWRGCTGGSDQTGPTPPEDTGDNGGAVIDEFAAAWQDPSVSAFRGVVDEPGVAAHDISAHAAELGITETTVEPIGDLDCGSNSCKEHAQVTHQLAGVGPWTYETLIKAEPQPGAVAGVVDARDLSTPTSPR